MRRKLAGRAPLGQIKLIPPPHSTPSPSKPYTRPPLGKLHCLIILIGDPGCTIFSRVMVESVVEEAERENETQHKSPSVVVSSCSFQLWNIFLRSQDLNTSRHTWFSANQPETFEFNHHLMNGRRGNPEISLNV